MRLSISKFRQDRGIRTGPPAPTRATDPDPESNPADAIGGTGDGLSGCRSPSREFLEPRETETRQDACARRLWGDASQTLRGIAATATSRRPMLSGQGRRPPLREWILRRPEDSTIPSGQRSGLAIVRRQGGKRIYAIPHHTAWCRRFEDHPFERIATMVTCALCRSTEEFIDEVVIDGQRRAHVRPAPPPDYARGRRSAVGEGKKEPAPASTETRMLDQDQALGSGRRERGHAEGCSIYMHSRR